MGRALRLNLALAAAVAALAAWVWLKPPAADVPPAHRLSTLERARVGSVRIERPGGQPIVLRLDGAGWRMTEPYAARASEPRIRQLLDLLEAAAPHRLEAAGLERFELDPPGTRLVVSDGTREQAFGFGLVNAVTREQYLLTNGAVYAVSPRYGTALPALPEDVVSERLFAPGEIPERIELPGFAVAQRDGAWRLTPPSPHVTADDIARWADGWRQASAARVERHDGPAPREEIRIGLKGGGTLRLGLLEREPHVVLLRPDENLRYYFRGESGMRLLAQPGAASPAKPAAGER